MRRTHHRSAFTSLELLVVITTLGLLMAILVPAVQRARAAARRSECVNKLKQIGLAVESFVEVKGIYPSMGANSYEEILQHMGELPDKPSFDYRDSPRFYCPEIERDGHLGVSYLRNSGTRFHPLVNGYDASVRLRRPADVTDGTSNTASFSERIPFNSGDVITPRPLTIPFWTGQFVARVPGNESQAVDNCRANRTTQFPVRVYAPGSISFGYDHFLTPNQPACWSGPAFVEDPSSSYRPIAPATSEHIGGVNVLFLDGHVTFVSENIDYAAWQAIGTINGREAVDF